MCVKKTHVKALFKYILVIAYKLSPRNSVTKNLNWSVHPASSKRTKCSHCDGLAFKICCKTSNSFWKKR